jgi:V8-like Glu-specific endopeptidase
MSTDKIVAAVVLCSSFCAGGVTAQTPVVFDRARTERQIAISRMMSPALPVTVTGVEVKSATSGTLLHRVHFTIAAVPGPGWTIEVADGGQTVVSDPLDAAVGDWWSPPLDKKPASVSARLKGPAGQTPPQVLADRIAVLVQTATPQAITPPRDDSASINTASPRIKTWGKSVARLQFIGSDGNGYFCTAFVVSATIMVTNNHCINTDAEMRSAFAEFDYDADGARVETQRFAALLVHDENLDYALLRLAKPSTRAALPLKDMPVAEQQGLLVIEHPAGKPKRVSLVDCQVRGVEMPGIGVAKTDFGHFCDTEGGSSGSPIQDTVSGAVLGLHHLGFQTGANIVVNRGVKIGLILSDLAQRAPAIRAEIETP